MLSPDSVITQRKIKIKVYFHSIRPSTKIYGYIPAIYSLHVPSQLPYINLLRKLTPVEPQFAVLISYHLEYFNIFVLRIYLILQNNKEQRLLS